MHRRSPTALRPRRYRFVDGPFVETTVRAAPQPSGSGCYKTPCFLATITKLLKDLATCAQGRERQRLLPSRQFGEILLMTLATERCVPYDPMSEADRQHWDARYADLGSAAATIEGLPPPPPVFAPVERLFPTQGHALELACGRGRGGVWLASRGIRFWGLDVSPVAIDLARELAAHCGLADRCRFDVADLDHGLPPGPLVDLVFVHLFRDRRLDQPVVERLKPGGMLAIAVLSEVGAAPGPFRARPGELHDAFSHLETLAYGEDDGMAWLLARRPEHRDTAR